MTLDSNRRMVKIENKKGCRVYPEGTTFLDAMTGTVAGRVVDVIECWYNDDVPSGEKRFGKTADNGTLVELWEYHDGTWFGIELREEFTSHIL